MSKFFIFILLFTIHASSFATDSIFQSEFLSTEDILSRYSVSPNIKSPTSLVSNQLVLSVLQDRDNKISNTFKIPKYFFNAVRFWFGIYTQYNSSHVLVHDRKYLKLIYDVMDFTELSQSDLNKFVKNKLLNKYSEDRVQFFKKILINLSKNQKTNDKTALKVLNLIKLAGIKIPSERSKAQKFFNELSENLRTQTGQQDMIYHGVLNSIPYFPFMENYARDFDLPPEILAIPFLESSFNLDARSKVGASGIWQIMPIMEKKLISKDKRIDGRINPFLASIAAFHLLKQNYRILDRWDLSVTAYNSGTKHMVKAEKVLGINNPSLEYIFTHYEHPHLGFASKNFYAEFLALVHVLAYRNLLFPLENVKGPHYFEIKQDNVHVYISKCPLIPNKTYEAMINISPNLDKLNNHLFDRMQLYGKGTIFISDVNLNTGLFYKMSSQEMKSNYPINWQKFVINQNCSTK